MPGEVEAGTVDHRLRSDSARDAEQVANVCQRLGVRHAVLQVDVPSGSSLQAQAREARYAALCEWAARRGLHAILTAHHADDQAETLLMRLARGAGAGGLAGVRARQRFGSSVLLRPLLGWRKSELEAIVADAALIALSDPANSDPRHDRTRVRRLLAEQPLLDPQRLAASAAHLAEAEEALAFAAELLFAGRAKRSGDLLLLDTADLPPELQRRLLLRAVSEMGAGTPRGPDLERALEVLASGSRCTLAGLLMEGGETWRLSPEPSRR